MAAKDHHSGRRLSRPSADFLAKAAFVLSALLLAFGYGVVTMEYKIFPHAILARAQQAKEALTKVEPKDHPPHYIRDLQAGDTRRIMKPAPVGDDSDLILMTGGFFYHTDACPTVGCMAWIMRRDGTVLHRWSADPAVLFNARDFKGYTGETVMENIFVQGVDLDREGNLIVIFEARNIYPDHVGIAKFAPNGRLLWRRIDQSHHWPTVGPDGRIYAPSSRIVPKGPLIDGLPHPPVCRGDRIDQQGVRVLSPEGKVLHEFWLEDVVRQSGLLAVGYYVRNDCDPFHVNGIELVDEAAAAKLRTSAVPDAKPGDMFVSLRASSTVLLMDSDSGRIKHIIHGPMVEQHSPALLPDGDMIIFDNVGAGLGPDQRSRLLKIAFAPERYEQAFPRPGGDDPHLFSLREGQVNVSADGKRALISETEGGRLFEVDLASGALLWSYREANDLSAYLTRVGSADQGKHRVALLHTQGAAYVSSANFSRMFGRAP
ncbi:MAG: arylsulfotransferase family protein [Novosphingobium sp.]